MNKLVWSLALSLSLSVFLSKPSLGDGVGNDNPTGVTGEFNGSITTGGSYDPYTGNAKRFVDDLTVTGSVGAYPLKFTRVLNTRAGSGSFGDGGGWRHSYQWGLAVRPPPVPNPPPCQPEVPDGTVIYPDGREMNLHREVDPMGVETWTQEDGIEPMGDRLVHLGGTDYDLRLKDGGRVEFRTVNGIPRVAKNIVDPYGQTTTLERDSMGRLWKITEPGGRYLLIYYRTYAAEPPAFPAPVVVIDRVEAYDGPQGRFIEKVQYDYDRENVSAVIWVRFYYLKQAAYDDGTHATYIYYPAGRVLPGNPWSVAAGKVKTCEDLRHAGVMSNIEYEYVPASQNQACPVAWGQIKAEKNMATHIAVSSVNYPVGGVCSSGNPAFFKRTETRPDGATRIFQYGSNSNAELQTYTDFSYTNGHHTTAITYTVPAPGNGNHYLQTVTNARGYPTSTEKDNNLGAVMAVIHPNGSRMKFEYSDPAAPSGYRICQTRFALSRS